MKQRNKNAIYLPFHSLILAIKHVLKKTKSLFIWFLLIGHLTILMSNKIIKIHYNTKLAFNLNTNHYEFINKNNINLKLKNISSLLFLDIFPNYNSKLSQKYTFNYKSIKTIEYLQTSGFFKRVEYFIKYIHNIQYFIIYLYFNPIVKKIEVQGYNKLQIPKTILIRIFQSQIGLPFNYKKIQNSIKKTYKWYQKEGFQSVYIKLIKLNSNNTISLKIFEGKIMDSIFICQTNSNTNKKLLNRIEKTIALKLNIKTGDLINIKKIEQGIIYLRKIRLIKNCKYEIQSNKQGVNIQVHYSIHNQSEGFFYNQSSNLKVNKSFNIKAIDFLNSITTYFQYKIKEILSHKYFGLKYCSSSIQSNYRNLITDIKFKNKAPYIKFGLHYPHVKINNHINISIILNFYCQLKSIKLAYPAYNIETRYSLNSNIVNYKTVYKINNISILYKCHVYNYFYINQQIINTYSIYNKKYLCANIYAINPSFNKSSLLFKIISKIITQKLLRFKIKAKYNDFVSTNKLNSGFFFNLESIVFTPIEFNKTNILHHKLKLEHNIKIKYHQVLILPKFLPYIEKNALKFFIEINRFITLNNPYKVFENYYNMNMYLEYSNKKSIRTNNYNSYLYALEYHILTQNLFSYYTFYNYSNQTNNICLKHKYKDQLGLGIQINIPIKKIPKIRFEYGINIYKNNS
uniref:POTRA domain-containing protein n=1 Tax=Dicranema revolutum TaxID=239144 RepID=A0A4D6WTT4_9FLOR|nr:hypothetical protein [Dicranema revolutum]